MPPKKKEESVDEKRRKANDLILNGGRVETISIAGGIVLFIGGVVAFFTLVGTPAGVGLILATVGAFVGYEGTLFGETMIKRGEELSKKTVEELAALSVSQEAVDAKVKTAVDSAVGPALAASQNELRRLRAQVEALTEEKQLAGRRELAIERGVKEIGLALASNPHLTLEQLVTELKRRTVPGIEIIGQIPAEFFCPITHGIFDNPVVANDGRSYELSALQSWYDARHRTCPMNPSAALSNPSTLPINIDLKILISEWKSRMEKLGAPVRDDGAGPADDHYHDDDRGAGPPPVPGM